MKALKAFFVSLLLTFLLFLFLDFNKITGNFIQKKIFVSKVIDGDTIELSDGERIRLLGINAPEKGEYLYEEASRFLRNEIEGKEVILEDSNQRDIYGRKLAYVIHNDKNLNVELLKNGFAHIFEINKIDKYKKELMEAEDYARENNLGIWKKSNLSDCIKLKDFVFIGKEKVVIKNYCNFSINVKGWSLEDEAHNRFNFPSYTLNPMEEIEVYTTEQSKFSFKSSYPIFNREGDTIFLRDNFGLLIFYYRY